MIAARRLALLASVVSVAATGCLGTPHPTESITIQKVGLDLAFKDEALRKAIPPQVLVQLIPAPPALAAEKVPDFTPYINTQSTTTPPVPAPVPPAPQVCPKAAAGAAPSAVAPVAIGAPPKPGKYVRINTGTVTATAGGVTLTLPYPAQTVMEVENVQTGQGPQGPVTSFDVTETLTPKNAITESYEYFQTSVVVIPAGAEGASTQGASGLYLTARSVKSGNYTTTTTLSPPVKVYDFLGNGTSWTSAGTDTASGRTLAVQASDGPDAVVDACGTPVDAQVVTSQTTLGDPTDGSVGGTESGKSDVTDIATQLGGLFVRRELHDSEVDTVDGKHVTITYDVVSVMRVTETAGA